MNQSAALVLLLLVVSSMQSYGTTYTSARCDAVTADIKAISLALDRYKHDNEKYPNGLDWTQELRKGGYIKKVPIDLWNRPYLYELIDDRTFKIQTLGEDGAIGGSGLSADYSNQDNPTSYKNGCHYPRISAFLKWLKT